MQTEQSSLTARLAVTLRGQLPSGQTTAVVRAALRQARRTRLPLTPDVLADLVQQITADRGNEYSSRAGSGQ